MLGANTTIRARKKFSTRSLSIFKSPTPYHADAFIKKEVFMQTQTHKKLFTDLMHIANQQYFITRIFPPIQQLLQ